MERCDMILGLDVSTTTTGYCVLDNDGSVWLTGAIDLSKEDNLIAKAKAVKNILGSIPAQISQVVIEKSLFAFTSGMSSAKTLHTLASFNGIVSWICYETFGLLPEYIGATSARSVLGIKIPKGTKAKEVVMSWVMANVPSFVPAKTKTGSMKKQYYDIADAIVIALASHKQEFKNG